MGLKFYMKGRWKSLCQRTETKILVGILLRNCYPNLFLLEQLITLYSNFCMASLFLKISIMIAGKYLFYLCYMTNAVTWCYFETVLGPN